MAANTMARRGNIVRRVVGLIDMMAAWRRPKSVAEITQSLNAKMNSEFCCRTIRRDLVALCEQGLVDRTSVGWRLNLERSESCQEAGIKLYD